MMSHFLIIGGIVFFVVDIILVALCCAWWYRKWRDEKLTTKTDEQPLIKVPDYPSYKTRKMNLPAQDLFSIPQLKTGNHKQSLIKMESLDKSIYMKRHKKPRNPGLCLELFYDLRKSEVHVTLVSGRNLPEYINEKIVVSVLMSHCFTIYHTARVDGPNPTFNEDLRFPLDSMQISSDPPVILKFNVWTIDKEFRKTPFGYTKVKVEDVFNEKGLTPAKGHGKIWYDVDKSNRLVGETPHGEVLIALSYLKAARRIVLTVIKARNMPISATEKYVQARIAVLYEENELKVCYSETVAAANNPKFNEEFSFNLADFRAVDVKSMTIRIEMQGRQAIVLLKPQVLGHVMLGNSSKVDRFGREHWDFVLGDGKSSLQKWYPILSVDDC